MAAKKQKIKAQRGAESPLEIAFAVNVAKQRKKRKQSQTDFAVAVGLSPSFLSMLERGVRVGTLQTIDRVARNLGVRAVDMLR